MKLAVLDGYTLNPGDLSWDALQQLGDVTVYDRTPADQAIARAKGADAIFTNKTTITEEILAQLPELKYIGILATGYNVVDIAAAAKRNITVTNVPAYSTPSVAQLTFALLLELCNHVQSHSDAVKEGEWVKSVDFSFWKHPILELQGKTMGIIGLGQIGRKVAEIAFAFGLDVIGYDINMDKQYTHPNFKWADLDKLLRESDIVSMHCPLFPENQGLINKDTLGKMKQTAVFINTARGGLMNEHDLADALNSGQIAGAGLDVLSIEPPSADNPLLSAKNCVMTPHIAWASRESRSRLMTAIVENYQRFLDNDPINVVN
ncbi:MAG: D-2-hydroxyacid dehydrogenase [Defluviitaleaceae bacterium]|nr:D-2-hydroxyacid dehydrogenase [Defluviitaleaceae bacterium]